MPDSQAAIREHGYWGWVPSAFCALRHRNYRLYWLGQVLSLTGTWMQRTALGWLVTDLVIEFVPDVKIAAMTNWYVAVISAMSTLPVLLLAGILGIFADMFDRRRILLITQSLMMVQAFMLALLAYSGLLSFPLLMVLALLLGIFMAADIPARQGLVIHLVGKEDLPNAIAINSGVFNGARVIGPAVTGIMLALKFSVADAFLVNAISFIPVIFAILLMRGNFKASATHSDERQSTIRRLLAGASYLAKTPGLRRIVLMIAINSFMTMPFVPLLPAISRYRLGAGPAEFGFLSTCVGIGALVGAISLAFLSKYRVHHITLRIGYAMLLSSVLLLSQTTNLAQAYVVLLFAGFGFNWAFASTNQTIQLMVPDHLRGRVMGTYSQVFIGIFPLGTLSIGWLASVIGVDKAIMIGALVASVSALLLLSPIPRITKAEKSSQP